MFEHSQNFNTQYHFLIRRLSSHLIMRCEPDSYSL